MREWDGAGKPASISGCPRDGDRPLWTATAARASGRFGSGWAGGRAWRGRRGRTASRHELAAAVLYRVRDQVLLTRGKVNSNRCAFLDVSKRQIELKGYHAEILCDGWPIDKNHPVYSRK